MRQQAALVNRGRGDPPGDVGDGGATAGDEEVGGFARCPPARAARSDRRRGAASLPGSGVRLGGMPDGGGGTRVPGAHPAQGECRTTAAPTGRSRAASATPLGGGGESQLVQPLSTLADPVGEEGGELFGLRAVGGLSDRLSQTSTCPFAFRIGSKARHHHLFSRLFAVMPECQIGTLTR